MNYNQHFEVNEANTVPDRTISVTVSLGLKPLRSLIFTVSMPISAGMSGGNVGLGGAANRLPVIHLKYMITMSYVLHLFLLVSSLFLVQVLFL